MDVAKKEKVDIFPGTEFNQVCNMKAQGLIVEW